MVRTVARSSVAKWPDSGATSSTRGCAWSMSFLKRSSVPNGVASHDLLVHRDLAIADHHLVDAEGRPHMGEPGARDQLVGGGQVAQHRIVAGAGERLADRLHGGDRQHADRTHDVRVRLIGLIEHSRSRRLPRAAATPLARRPTQPGPQDLVDFLVRCEIIMPLGCPPCRRRVSAGPQTDAPGVSA